MIERARIESRLSQLAEELAEEMTLDGLTRDFVIFQRRRGHRHSTDDLLTAWYAATKVPSDPATMLDLGTGIGSIGLSLAWRFERASLTAIEAQSISYRLLGENIWANDVGGRVRPFHGDLRALHDVIGPGQFDLVTGSPPYFDVKNGIVSADSQRAHARFELRGDVNDYCRAARSALAPTGRFVFCFPTVQRARAVAACKNAGLALLTMRDVVPRVGIAPLFSLFACAHGEAATIEEPPLVVRDASGTHTSEMKAVRALFGMT